MFADEYLKWLFLRYKASKDETNEMNTQKIHSFSSLKSITSITSVNLTCIIFTPKIPYQATNYNTTCRVMVTFQDVLQQRHQDSGAL